MHAAVAVVDHDEPTDVLQAHESLFFANTAYLEDEFLGHLADQPQIKHLVLILCAVDVIDASALETLDTLIARLCNAGVTLHMAEVKGPMMNKLQIVAFEETRGARVYLGTLEAISDLTNGTQAKAAQQSALSGRYRLRSALTVLNF